MPGLYAWLRRNPRLVDGALALLLVYPGGGRLLVTLPFTLGMVVPVVFRRKYPVAAFAAVIAAGALQVLLLRRPTGADLAVLIVLYTLAACRPQPGIDELGELLGQARAAGLPVALTVSGVPRPVPAGEALTVFRIVQESLTNVRKHAGPGVTAAVSLGYAEEGLMIRVTDDGRGPGVSDSTVPGGAGPDGDGHGLAGMRERIELYGGSVRTGPRPGGGYEVVARLPLALEPA